MKHEFTRPARVVEVRIGPTEEEDLPTGELIGPAPVATDDGEPLHQAMADAAL